MVIRKFSLHSSTKDGPYLGFASKELGINTGTQAQGYYLFHSSLRESGAGRWEFHKSFLKI
jgi:hypothetical protein